MRKWNVQKPEVAAAVSNKEQKHQQWTAIIDGILFVSFKSYEDLMDKIREYKQSK